MRATARNAVTTSRTAGVLVLALALVVSLLPGLAAAQQPSEGDFAIVVSDAGGYEAAAGNGDRITFSGTVPAGAIQQAAVIGRDADGSELRFPINARQPSGNGQGSYDRNTDGQLDGQATLNSCFQDPADDPPPSQGVGCPVGQRDGITSIFLELTIGGTTARNTTPLPNDYTAPRILRFDIVSPDPDQIVVVFSEPVNYNPNSALTFDSPQDWEVDDGAIRVTGVQNDCSPNGNALCGVRRLSTGDIPEDREPTVLYSTGGQIGVGRTYIDRAGNLINASTQASTDPYRGNGARAADRVRPSVPSIVSADSRSPDLESTVRSSERAPAVQVGNLNVQAAANGQMLEIFVDGTRRGQPFTYDQTSETVQVPDLGADGVHTIEIVARDQAGNSTRFGAERDAASPARPDPARPNNPLTYILDTKRPQVLNATQTGPAEVTVSISEVILPPAMTQTAPANAGAWRIDGVAPTSVTLGPGDNRAVRVLRMPSAVTSGARLSWNPTEESTYTDRVDLELVPVQGLLVVPPPPLDRPTISFPTPGLVLRSSQQEITGRAPEADSIELYDDGALVSTTPVADDGSFAIPVTLTRDEEHGDGVENNDGFSVVARSDVGGISQEVDVQAMDFDPDAPDVTVTDPAPVDTPPVGSEDPTASAGDPLLVAWEIIDAHATTVDILGSVDGGDFEPLATGLSGASGSETVEVPEDAVSTLDIRVVATDIALPTGNVGQGDAPATVQIGDVLGFRARLTGNANPGGTIVASFDEVPTGNTSGNDWRADDGVPDTPRDNTPVSAQREAADVTLRFLQTFPPASPDLNAEPRVSFAGGLLSTLQGPQGEAISNLPAIAVDTTPPGAPGLSVPSGPLDAEGDRVAVDGATHPSVFPNTIELTIDAVEGSFAQAAPVTTRVEASPDGSFAVDVPLFPDSLNQISAIAVDPRGNESPPSIGTLLEDSRFPSASLGAAISPDLNVVITHSWDEDVTDVQVIALVPGEAPELLQTVEMLEQGEVLTTTWTPPATAVEDGAQVQVRGTDVVGHVGEATAGLFAAPVMERAVARSERVVEIETSVPVTTDARSPAGFLVLEGPVGQLAPGPGVADVEVDGRTITLRLNSDLSATTPTVRYVGNGGWVDVGSRALAAGEIRAVRDFVFPVTGLAVGPAPDGGANTSWVDGRNRPEHVVSYEIRRDGELIAELAPDVDRFTDVGAADGEHVYSVVVVDDDGRRSAPAEAAITLGGGPAGGGEDGGTSFPPGATVVQDCPFPGAPNLTPEGGGTILSCDLNVAVIVPPGAVAEDTFARIIQRRRVETPGFSALSDLYQVVGVTAEERLTLDAVAAYSELSFRPGAESFAAVTAERLVGLRPHASGQLDELGLRTAVRSAATQLLTLGTFGLAQADGATVRVFGPDPAVAADRFATAAGLSQTTYRRAGAAVIARADDYPDALAASALAAQIGGPVLLSRTTDVPLTTLLELRRLGVEEVVLVGGTVALSADVQEQLVAAGFDIDRVAGATRFHTSAAVAERVGSFLGEAFLAVGNNFADALAASGPSAALTRPILLTQTETLTQVTADALFDLGVTDITIVGGDAVVSPEVEAGLVAGGYDVTRAAGPNRYATAVTLATQLVEAGVQDDRRPVIASGQGDGRTSPDALAAGPIASRHGSPLLLIPRDVSIVDVDTYLSENAADIRGIVMAGGPAAVTPEVRSIIDAQAR